MQITLRGINARAEVEMIREDPHSAGRKIDWEKCSILDIKLFQIWSSQSWHHWRFGHEKLLLARLIRHPKSFRPVTTGNHWPYTFMKLIGSKTHHPHLTLDLRVLNRIPQYQWKGSLYGQERAEALKRLFLGNRRDGQGLCLHDTQQFVKYAKREWMSGGC